MPTVKSVIQSAINAKSATRNAINTAAQGTVTIPANAKLSTYAAYVNQIPQPLPEAEPNDVNFFDYDGTLRYSYSATEFASLTALPELPQHEHLTSQEWNWTLSDAKTEVQTTGKLNIGLSCASDTGTTILFVRIPDDNYTAHLNLGGRNSSAIVHIEAYKDWVCREYGDDEFHITSDAIGNTNKTYNLTFSSAGEYIIEITVAAGTVGLGHVNSKGVFGDDRYLSAARDARMCSILYKVFLGTDNIVYDYHAFAVQTALETIAMPKNPVSNINWPWTYNHSLKFIVFPNSNKATTLNYMDACYSLSGISFSKYITKLGAKCCTDCRSLKYFQPTSYITDFNDGMSFGNCYNLQEIKLPAGTGNSSTTIVANAFANCRTVKSIEIPARITSLDNTVFTNDYSLEEIKMLSGYGQVVAPTITSTTLSNIPSDCKLLVPFPHISIYANSTNWVSRFSYTTGSDPRDKNDMFFISNPNNHVDMGLKLFITCITGTSTYTIDYVGSSTDIDLFSTDWNDQAFGSWEYNSILQNYFYGGFSVFVWLNPGQDNELIEFAPNRNHWMPYQSTVIVNGQTYNNVVNLLMSDERGDSRLHLILSQNSSPWGWTVDYMDIDYL